MVRSQIRFTVVFLSTPARCTYAALIISGILPTFVTRSESSGSMNFRLTRNCIFECGAVAKLGTDDSSILHKMLFFQA